MMRLLPRGRRDHHSTSSEANPNPNASTLPRQPSFAGSRVGDEPGPKRHLYIETKLIRSALLCHLSF